MDATMKMKKTFALAVMLAVGLAMPAAAAQGKTYFVAPGGADSNPGTIEQPFATLARAQQAARQAQVRAH